MNQIKKTDVSSAGLHILAMALMLCDHMWAMLFPAAEWLTCIGRVAFPIFAFLTAEGYRHTRDLRKYLLRMLLWAVVAEVPFDLMYGGTVFYPFHQNVLWTFLLSLLLMALLDKIRARFQLLAAALLSALAVLLGFALGYAAMVDYYGAGVLMVLTFYFFRERNWKSRVCQLIFLYILNVKLLGGFYYGISLFGHEVEIVQQGFALLALIPIWLYQGRQGHHSKAFQYICYAFYPAHMLALFAVRELVLR